MAENKDYKFVDHYEFDEELLKKAFAEARKIYKERGFMRKMGFGKAPAITTVDMARAWMSEGHPFYLRPLRRGLCQCPEGAGSRT